MSNPETLEEWAKLWCYDEASQYDPPHPAELEPFLRRFGWWLVLQKLESDEPHIGLNIDYGELERILGPEPDAGGEGE